MSSGEPPSSAAQVISKSGSPVSDIDNMKVPELKKRLKSMGLSTGGNKAELIERLHDAYLGEKDGSLDGGLDDDSLEEALLNDDPDQSALSETLMGNADYSFSSPEKDTQKQPLSAAAKPLKKRAITHVDDTPAEPPKVSKPIVLKRNNYPVIEAPKEECSKKDHPLIEPPKCGEPLKAAKPSSMSDQLQLRAKRFNITETKVKPTAVKEGKVGVASPILSNSGITSNLDILRKRAERFGENVSTVMKKLENQEKLMKRKMKFTGDSDVTSSNSFSSKTLSSEQERKKKRMERFGLLK